MAGWILLIVLAALLLVPLRLLVTYDEHGFRTEFRFGVLRIGRLRGKANNPNDTQEDRIKGGSTQGWREKWELISVVLEKLWYRIRVRELSLYYCHAADDPADAAVGYGAASAAAAALFNVLEKTLKIQHYELRAWTSFTETKPSVFLRVRLFMPLATVLGILWSVRAELKRRKMPAEAVKEQ